MTGLDTNALLRFLLGDDEDQHSRLNRLLRQARNSGEPIFLSVIVVCEVVWVLRSRYGMGKREISDTIEAAMSVDQFVFEEEAAIRESLSLFRKGNAGFSDYLIGRINGRRGCRRTVTFDRKLRNDAAFHVL